VQPLRAQALVLALVPALAQVLVRAPELLLVPRLQLALLLRLLLLPLVLEPAVVAMENPDAAATRRDEQAKEGLRHPKDLSQAMAPQAPKPPRQHQRGSPTLIACPESCPKFCQALQTPAYQRLTVAASSLQKLAALGELVN